jgi:hypothetical protein
MLLLLCYTGIAGGPEQGSSGVPDLLKVRSVVEGEDLNARLALLADLKQIGQDAIPTEIQDYLIDRAIRDFEERMDNGMLVDRFTDYARLLNTKFDAKEKMRSEIMFEQMDLALTFHRPAFLPRLVLLRPGGQILQAYGAEGLQAMLDQGERIMEGRRYANMAFGVSELMRNKDRFNWWPTTEQLETTRRLFQMKLDELEARDHPGRWPENPEALIESLIALGSPGIEEQGARVLGKCLPHETVLGTVVLVRFMAGHRLPGTGEVLQRLMTTEPAGPIRDHYEALAEALRAGKAIPDDSPELSKAAWERDQAARKDGTDAVRSAQARQLKILGLMAAVGTVITVLLGIGWWRWLKRRKTS